MASNIKDLLGPEIYSQYQNPLHTQLLDEVLSIAHPYSTWRDQNWQSNFDQKYKVNPETGDFELIEPFDQAAYDEYMAMRPPTLVHTQDSPYDSIDISIKELGKYGWDPEEYPTGPITRRIALLSPIRPEYVREATFKKNPLRIPKWRTAEELYKQKVDSLNYNRKVAERYLKAYTDAIIAPNRQFDRSSFATQEEKNEAIARMKDWLNNIDEQQEQIKDVSFIDERRGNPQLFLKSGEPSQMLKSLYRRMRGSGKINNSADLIGYFSGFGSPGQTGLFNAAVKDGLLAHDQRTGATIVPRNIIRKVDPYYREYVEEKDKLLPASQFGKWNKANRLGLAVGLRGFKNLNRVPEAQRGAALDELDHWAQDTYHGYTWLPGGDSKRQEHTGLNDLRRTAAQIAHDEEQQRLISEGGGKTDLDTPFEYSDEVQSTAENKGWHLFIDPADQIYTGMGLRHCYGDIDTFGDLNVQRYCNRIRQGQDLVMTKNGVTASIRLRTDAEGNIKSAEVDQVHKYDNVPLDRNSDLYKEVKKIAEELKGKNLLDQTEEEEDPPAVSDIILKYLPKTNQNMANIIRKLR